MAGTTAALLLAGILGLTCAPISCAAGRPSISFRASNARVRRDDTATSAVTLPSDIPNVGLHPQCQLLSRASLANVQGTITTRYDVFCLGFQFYGGRVTVETNSSGAIVMPGGVDIHPPALKTFVPTLNEAAGISESDAFEGVAATLSISPTNFDIYAIDKQINVIWYDDGVRVIAAYYLMFNYQEPGQWSHPIAIVDRTTGEVKSHWDGLHGAYTQKRVRGIGGNFYDGLYYTDVWGYADDVYFCFNDTAARYRINDFGGTYFPVKKPFCGKLTDIVNYTSSVPILNHAFYYNPLVTASFAAKLADDMFKTLVGVGFNGWSSKIVDINVNFGTVDDAFTDVLSSQIYLGTGATKFYPLATCWDVVVHEIAHIHIDRFSGLGKTGQPGAINEAYCDMAAEAAELFYYNDWHDNLFGTSCVKWVSASTNRIRHVCRPEYDGDINHIRDWYPGMNVYTAGGVFRRAYCAAATCTTANIGFVPAFKAFARANMLYWSPSSNFSTAACGVLAAAYGIFGQQAAVDCFVKAFAEVGIVLGNPCYY